MLPSRVLNPVSPARALIVLCLAGTTLMTPARATPPGRDVMLSTYSIVARDPETGALGVAVQSHWPAVGTMVPWVEEGVGAIATQAMTETRYGRRGLELLREGRAPKDVFAEVAREDPQSGARQVAIVDAQGRVFVHTGEGCIPVAGHVSGDGFSVQANLMGEEGVVEAMAAAYRTTGGSLAVRLLAALQAAEKAGGDLRGCQAAALRVVGGPAGSSVDLRVDDHEDPVGELARLLEVHQAYQHYLEALQALSDGDLERADERMTHTTAGRDELALWYAVEVAKRGHLEAARKWYHGVIASHPDYDAWLDRLPGTSVLPDADEGRRLLESLRQSP